MCYQFVRSLFYVLFISLSFSEESRETFIVSGNVFLEDSLSSGGTHEDITISIYDLLYSPPQLVTSGTSQSDGSYSVSVDPGYYVIEWSKDGYVPFEIGDIALGADLEVEDITLLPGSVLEVGGEVSGNWTANYQYWVTDDLIVPEGETLTIDAGVRVKFYPGTGLTSYGSLEVNGTSENGILFTSKNPTPTPGDWTNVQLYGQNNIISYLEYEWADNGFTGANAHNTTFDNLYINGTLSLDANGIYLEDSDNLWIENVYIVTGGDFAIYCDNSENSFVSSNTIIGSYDQAAIRMNYCDTCYFEGNNISGSPYRGIWTQYSTSNIIVSNILNIKEVGIEAQDGSGHTIVDNQIENFNEHGIYFNCSENVTITDNEITKLNAIDTVHGIFNSCGGQNAVVLNNTLNLGLSGYSCCDGGGRDLWAITSHQSIIDGNVLELDNSFRECGCDYTKISAIRANNSTITNNLISMSRLTYYENYEQDCWAIESFGSQNERSLIENNNITVSTDESNYRIGGISSSYANVRLNTLYTEYSGAYAFDIGNQDSLMNNTAIGFNHGIYAGGVENPFIENNNLTINCRALYSSYGSGGEHQILNNNFQKIEDSTCGDYAVEARDFDNILMEGNTFTGGFGQGFYIYNTAADIKRNLLETMGRGITVENQAGTEFSQNTIISSNNGDYGFHISNLSAPVVYSNIIQGYQTGIYAENSLSNPELRNNDMWLITENDFEGSAMPPLIGNYVSSNVNGDPSDIYGNISMDPIFTNEFTGDYTLASISPCINAGNPSVLDPDGTTGDIGAFYHHIYMVIEHAGMANTIDTDGPYTVNASAYATNGDPIALSLFYTTDGGDTITEMEMTNISGDNYSADIPGQPLDTRVEYYLLASDGENTLVEPYGAPESMLYFDVTLVVIPSDLATTSNVDGTIDLTWTPPVLSFGQLINQQLYRSVDGDVGLDDFYSNLSLEDFTFTDSDVFEGDEYTYKIMGSIDVEGEIQTLFISEPVSATSDDATIVYVDGFVTLEGTDDLSNVMIEFERTSPTPTVYDTVYTDSDGFYQHTPSVGIYNLNYFKYGWQPGQIGNIYLTQNTEVEDVHLDQGYSVYVSGDVSGEWTSENVYFVEGDINVASGDTLRINPGVDVFFMGDYSLTTSSAQEEYISCNGMDPETCNSYPQCSLSMYEYGDYWCVGDEVLISTNGGTIIAEGSEGDRIRFTSGQPIAEDGDWNGITLNGNGNILRYVDYEYANRELQVYDGTGFVFEHSTISNLPLNTSGLYIEDNSDSLKINHNHFDVSGSYSVIAQHSDFSTFNNNVIDGTSEYAFDVANSSYSEFSNNIFNKFYEYAIYARSSHHMTFNNNYFFFEREGDWKRGIDIDSNTSGQGHKNNSIYNNTFVSSDECLTEYCRMEALVVMDAEVYDNTIDFSVRSDCDSWARGIYSDRSNIYNNTVFIQDLSTCNGKWKTGILAWSGNDNNRSSIYNNTVTMVNANIAIAGDYVDIYDNVLDTGTEYDHGNWAIEIGNYSNIYNNEITNYDSGIYSDQRWNLNVYNNNMKIDLNGIQAGRGYGTHRYENNVIIRENSFGNDAGDNHWFIYVSERMDSLFINNNNMQGASGSGIYVHDNDNLVLEMKNNTIKAEWYGAYFHRVNMDAHHNLFNIQTDPTTGTPCNSDYDLIRMDNSNTGDFYNNTIVGNKSSCSGDNDYSYRYGIHTNTYSDVNLVNNIIMGSDIGIYAESELSVISNNNMWDNNVDYQGSGLPALIGDVNTVNSNGTPSDVYANISQNPSFVMQDEDNFNLQIVSACINAGNEVYQDPDGTTSDIGAFFRDINDTEDVFGCINQDACNYNPYANQDNGSCTYAQTWFADQDGDGLGSASTTTDSCNQPNGFVGNSNDLEPNCTTNDTDDCGICAGENLNKDCNDECFGTAFVDDCGVCSEGSTGITENSNQDCNGVCFGEAYLDGCSECVGGDTGATECPQDCNGVFDGTAVWDDCGVCSGGNTEHVANSDMDCLGICYGAAVVDDFDGCCVEDDLDDCGKCSGNNWDYCDEDEDGVTNYDQWGYGVHSFEITDVPNDQGGWVMMSFDGSFHDTDSLRTIEVYTIERLDGDYWTSLHTISAYASDRYYTEVRTATDSTSTSNGITEFRVIANMDEGNYQNREAASGYSVDNIAPEVPDGLMAWGSGSDLNIAWNTPIDPDFAYHEIHNLYSESFYSSDNEVSFEFEGFYNEHYINSVDTHDNISEKSSQVATHDLSIGANLLTFSVLPQDNSLGNVIDGEGISNIIAEGIAASNNPVLGWVGSLTHIEPNKGYWVLSSDGKLLSTVGEKNLVNSFDLHPGANLVSYTCIGDQEVSNLVNDESIISIIGQGVATTYNPILGWVGSLISFETGSGYWIKSDSDIEFSYDCLSSDVTFARENIPNLSNEYVQSTEQAFYFFADIPGVEIGDIVKSYNGDTVVGSRVWSGAYTDIPVMGKDIQEATSDYISTGEIPTFRLFKQTGEQLNVSAEIVPFTNNGIQLIENAEISEMLPSDFALFNAYPNPFNPSTNIEFYVPESSKVILEVYNTNGRKIDILADKNYDAGRYSVIFNGAGLSSGIYFVKMSAGQFNHAQKIMLIK